MTSKKIKKTKHVLLIWAEVPENIDYFLIPLEEITKEERKWIRRCHGNYINSTQTVFNGKFTQKQIDQALFMVSERLANPDAQWLKEDPEYFERQAKQYEMSVEDFVKMYGSWCQYKIDLAKPALIPRCRLVQSGFLL